MRLGVLVARIVRGEDAQVGVAAGDLAHQGTLGGVTVAAAAEDGDHLTGGETADRGEDLL